MKKHILSSLLLLPLLAHAHDVIDDRPKPLDIITTPPTPKDEPTQASQTSLHIDEHTLAQNPTLAHAILTSALKNKQWELVGDLLDIYHAQAGEDLLYHIAGAGHARFVRDYKTAFLHYQKILTQDPNLHHFRLDYAIALIEEKRYADAKRELDTLKDSPLDDTHAPLLTKLHQHLNDKQQAKTHASANFEKTDNVNGASSERYLTVGDKRFEKDPSSMPKKATGLSYEFGIQKEQNKHGNHYLTYASDLSGVMYWDNSDYNETTATIKAGYAYQDHNSTARLTPFMDYTLFDDKAYRRQVGVSAHLWQTLAPKWQVSLGASSAYQDHFDQNTKNTYNGRADNANATIYHSLRPNLLVYTGLDIGSKNAKSDVESYHKKGVRVGVQFYHDTLPSARLDVRFGKRTHDAPHSFFNTVRTDNETALSGAIWYGKWHYKGYTPMLNYRYTNIDSSIDALYSRTNQSYFLSVQKLF